MSKRFKDFSIISSQDPDEVSNFTNLSNYWWDDKGPFRLLHEINPVRIKYIIDSCSSHFNKDLVNDNAFKNLKLFDVGTGGGLIAEPLSRVGFKVTGIDPSDKNVIIAKNHSKIKKLDINYIQGSPEDKKFDGLYFDVILALEVVEHVSNVELFIKSLCNKLNPGGIIIFSTINKTIKSLFLAKFSAEYILSWVPKGTHDWNKFLKPSELSREIRNNKLDIVSIKGLKFSTKSPAWHLSKDVSMNYFLAATKQG